MYNYYINMEIQKIKINELKPAPYNSRQSNKKQNEDLKKSLEKFWLVDPIIYNKQTGFIVWGHFRIRELKKLWYKEVECVIVDLNKEDEKELNIRLNSNTWSWDMDLLSTYFELEELKDFWLELNFDIWNDIDFDDIKSNEDREASKKEQEVCCPDCWKQFKI